MSMATYCATCLSVFLLTYSLHSTVILGGLSLLLKFSPRDRRSGFVGGLLRHPANRVVLWKLAIVLPIVTTLMVTLLGTPHLGMQLVIGDTAAVRGESWVGQPLSGAMRVDQSQTDSLASRLNVPQSDADVTALAVDADFRFRAAVDAPSESNRSVWLLILVTVWTSTIVLGAISLLLKLGSLKRIRGAATPIDEPALVAASKRLQHGFGIRRAVELLRAEGEVGPLAAGILQPFILMPHSTLVQSKGRRRASGRRQTTVEFCDDTERDIVLAHELAHIAHRDALWNLVTQLIVVLFAFQPLNRFATRRLRQEMDFLADLRAVGAVGERASLAQLLIRLSETLGSATRDRRNLYGLASGMASFQSLLGQRVQLLLSDAALASPVRPRTRASVITLMVTFCFLAAACVPRAVAEQHSHDSRPLTRNSTMHRYLAPLAVLAGFTLPVLADDQDDRKARQSAAQSTELKESPDELPAGVKDFSGMLVGRLAAKDVEKGRFVVLVEAVPRVWRNNKADSPKSLVGKTVEVDGVFGKFLDVLVVMKKGETIEFEAKHNGGTRLTFPGESLRKVATYDPNDYPELPESFRGFAGTLAGKVIKKDPETFALIVEVNRVNDTWEKNSAKQPKSIEGRPMMLAGFWSRKDAYHQLKVGDYVEFGASHVASRSDHLNVTEFVRKVENKRSGAAMMKREGSASVSEGLTGDLRGFRGMLVGRLVEKDVERGQFTITVDAVPRVWKNSTASLPKSFIGNNVTAGGVTGEQLDVLVVAKPGETIQLGAIHEGGDQVRVVELLRKVAPVKPGDYPILPDGFRGFRGLITAKVVRKDDGLLSLIAEVQGVDETFSGSKAKDEASVKGCNVTLTGFWRRKEAFHNLQPGDLIVCGVEQPELMSDHLNVIETFRKE